MGDHLDGGPGSNAVVERGLGLSAVLFPQIFDNAPRFVELSASIRCASLTHQPQTRIAFSLWLLLLLLLLVLQFDATVAGNE